MWSIFKKRKYDDAGIKYLRYFEEKSLADQAKARFIVLDTETTGLNTKKDVILSIGAVAVSESRLKVNDSFEIYLNQPHYKPETAAIHGILKEGKMETVEPERGLKLFLEYIKGDFIVAHHAAFDLEMLNRALEKENLPPLKNKVIDTGNLYRKLPLSKSQHISLDELAEKFAVPLQDRHTASGDAYITAIIFLKILSRLRSKSGFEPNDLFG